MPISPSLVCYEDANTPSNSVAVSLATPLPTTSGGSGVTADQVQGNVASGSTDVGNPVKVGATYSGASTPTVTTGQRVDLQADNRGNLRTLTAYMSAADADGATFTGAGQNFSQGSNANVVIPQYGIRLLNAGGTTYDRMRGDTNGAWVKTPLSAGTDRSITTSAASQQLMAANTTRYKFFVKNDTAVIQWINLGGTAVAAAGTGNIQLAANGGYYEFTGYNGAVNIISGGAASAVTAREFP